MAELPKNRLNSASNLPRTTRWRFSHSEKLRIVEAADRCTKPGELGLLLRKRLLTRRLRVCALSVRCIRS